MAARTGVDRIWRRAGSNELAPCSEGAAKRRRDLGCHHGCTERVVCAKRSTEHEKANIATRVTNITVFSREASH
jgi:hypothetical protein